MGLKKPHHHQLYYRVFKNNNLCSGEPLYSSNYTYINFILNKRLNKFFSAQKLKKKLNLNKNLINNYLFFKFSNLSKNMFFIKLNKLNFNSLVYKYYIYTISKKFKKYSTLLEGYSKVIEVISIVFLMLISKDTNFFYRWFIKIFEKVFYKKHKRILYFLKLLFLNYISIYMNLFKCTGYCFNIKGKLGVGGNSKKRRYGLKIGINTLTTKDVKFTFNKGIVRTSVGVLGFKQVLHYL